MTDKTSSQTVRWAMLALITGGIAIGTSPIFVRLSEVGPLATAFWRLSLAFIPLYAFGKFLEKPEKKGAINGAKDYFALTLPGFFLGGDLALWHASVHITTVANATLFANMAPIFVALGVWFLYGIKPTKPFVIGLVLAIIGVVTLKGGPTGLLEGEPFGDSLAIIAAVLYSGYLITLAKLRLRYTALQIMIWSTFSAAAAMFVVTILLETPFFPVSYFGWIILIGLALITHAGGQGLIAYSLAYLPASFSSLTLLIQPVVAAILAWFLLGEGITIFQMIGGLIVISGIMVASRK